MQYWLKTDVVSQNVEQGPDQHDPQRCQRVALSQEGGLRSHGQEHDWIGVPSHRRVGRAVRQHFRYGDQLGEPEGHVKVAGGEEEESQGDGRGHGHPQDVLDGFFPSGGRTGHHGGGGHGQEHEEYGWKIDDHATWAHGGHLCGSAESTDEGGIDHGHQRIGEVDAQGRQCEFEDVTELFCARLRFQGCLRLGSSCFFSFFLVWFRHGVRPRPPSFSRHPFVPCLSLGIPSARPSLPFPSTGDRWRRPWTRLGRSHRGGCGSDTSGLLVILSLPPCRNPKVGFRVGSTRSDPTSTSSPPPRNARDPYPPAPLRGTKDGGEGGGEASCPPPLGSPETRE
eukprot:scaffold148_cov341-Pavlova_lutheri.AAC.14